MKRILRTSIALLLTLHCCAFSTTAVRADEKKDSKVVAGNNQFSLNAWEKLPKVGNLFWSPFNFRMAMTVCYYGARETTATEMKDGLSIDESVKPMDFGRMAVKAIQTKGDLIQTANGFWVEDSVKVNDFYKAFLTGLGAKCESVPFAKEPEKTRESINEWVSEKTKEKIKELLAKGIVSENTRCVIASTIYFKADWETPFNKELSKDAIFCVRRTNKDVDTIGDLKVPFMEVHGRFQYMETEDAQVVELPYKGKEISMVIILPKNPGLQHGVELLEKLKLAQAMVGNKDAVGVDTPWFKKTNMMVAIPKWKTSCEVKGTQLLKDLGVTSAFSKDADFSGAFGKDSKISLSEVIHKAVIEVDEKGTEAAAGTAVIARDMAIIEKPKVFKADHTFMYLIRHESTGAILFMGRVENPKEN